MANRRQVQRLFEVNLITTESGRKAIAIVIPLDASSAPPAEPPAPATPPRRRNDDDEPVN